MVKAVVFDMYETLITQYGGSLYFGSDMAEDAGITKEQFLKIWSPAESDRATGKYTLEEILTKILKTYNCYSTQRMQVMIDKRMKFKREAFYHLHKDIIKMLDELKEKKIKIGLISNCFSDEAKVIKESQLYHYFDAVCLSFDERVQKPEKEIFYRCMERLGVRAEECVYIGDGGSNELEAAKQVGMKAMQAIWYLNDDMMIRKSGKKDRFQQLESPLDVLEVIWEK